MPTDPKFDREQAERIVTVCLQELADEYEADGLPWTAEDIRKYAALAHIASLEKPVVPEAVERVASALEAQRQEGVFALGLEAATMLRSLAAENAALKEPMAVSSAPFCLCPNEIIERVRDRHGVCHRGGCPYGGDF